MHVLKPFGSLFAVLQRALDASLIALALWGASVALDREWSDLHTFAAIASIVTFFLIGEARKLYASWRLATIDEEFHSVLLVWGITSCALIVTAFLVKTSTSYSRLEVLMWFCTAPALLIWSRLAIRGTLRALRTSGKNIRSVAVVGATTVSKPLIQMLQTSATFGVKLAGVFDDRGDKRLSQDGVSIDNRLGSMSDLVELCKHGQIDYVFIALPMRAEKRIVELVSQLADTTASVYVVPDLFVFDLMRAHWVSLGGLPAVSVYESPFDGLSGWIKRAEDVVLGSILVALAAAPMIVVGIGLKLTSPGSIFFRQKRYGLNGRVVRVWKFRTMTVSEDGADVVQVVKGQQDSRVTPFGRFLRATSLDELPQLFNVLSGEMSLVGPRPHAVKVNEEFRRLIHGYMLRHKVKPGITGWAQVNGWHGEDTVEKMQQRIDHDLAYLQNWSLWLDLRILALTIAGVFWKRRGSTESAVA